MEEKPKNRKKGVYLLMALFLAGGGGIFLYFILQGAEDMKGGPGNFSYGTVVREGVSSFFRSVGALAGDDDETKRKLALHKAKMEALEASQSSVDISDWMGKAAPAGKQSSAPAGRPSASSRPPTSVPKMSGRGGGGVGGGGGTKSSGGASGSSKGASKFTAGSSGGNLKISDGKSAQGGPGKKDGGTLGSLRNAQATLKGALQTSSAMTAKTQWGRSFAGGSSKSGGGSGGALGAYGKSGLVSLDNIRSGEISDLKTTEGSAPAASAAKAIPDPTKTMQQSMASLLDSKTAGRPTTPSAPSETPPENKNTPEDPNTPPPSVVNAMETTSSYCKQPCGSYTDSPPTYTKNGDGWTGSYSGFQANQDGSRCEYTVVYDITGEPPVAAFNADKTQWPQEEPTTP